MVGAYGEPSSGKGGKPIHSILCSVAHGRQKGDCRCNFIIQGRGPVPRRYAVPECGGPQVAALQRVRCGFAGCAGNGAPHPPLTRSPFPPRGRLRMRRVRCNKKCEPGLPARFAFSFILCAVCTTRSRRCRGLLPAGRSRGSCSGRRRCGRCGSCSSWWWSLWSIRRRGSSDPP